MIKHLANDKIEIISEWEEFYLQLQGNNIKYPATVRLKHPIRKFFSDQKFSIKSVYRRDHYLCQYCGDTLTSANVSVDHVLPKSRGGKSIWENCVTACKPCNGYKGDKLPEEAGLFLKKVPGPPPKTYHLYDYYKLEKKHPEWKNYLGIE